MLTRPKGPRTRPRQPDPTRAPTEVCRHCGSPLGSQPAGEFCCSGCRFVHGLIQQNNLGRFYELRDAALPPVGNLVFKKREDAWLRELVRQAEPGPVAQVRLDLQGVSCLACVWLVERLFLQHGGALEARVEEGNSRLFLRWTSGAVDIPAYAQTLQQFGYLVGPPDQAPAARADTSPVRRLGICGALALNAMLFSLPFYLGLERSSAMAPVFESMAMLCATLSFLVGGLHFLNRGLRAWSRGVWHLDLPIGLGVTAAFAGSWIGWRAGQPGLFYFDFVAVFTFLMLAGRWAQERAVAASRRFLLGSHAAVPRILLETDNRLADTTAEKLTAGQRYFVAPSAVVPVKSRLVSPGASVGMDWISGEANPRTYRAGSLLASGGVNYGQERLCLDALEGWEDSALARLMAQRPAAASAPAPAQQQWLAAYLLAVLLIASAGGVLWLASGAAWWTALQVFISVLVVSCPCAIGVALPLADELASALARAEGVFVCAAETWARLPRIREIVFDKTGTLTSEWPRLANPEELTALPPAAQHKLLQLVRDSGHPVSCTLREELLARGAVLESCPPPVTEVVGHGLAMADGKHLWQLGRLPWASTGRAGSAAAANPAATCLSRDGQILARFQFADLVRPDARTEIQRLQAAGRRVHILSGDAPAKVRQLARELGLAPRLSRGGVSPEDKARAIERLGAGATLMVGDGANDSLAFNASACCGTPAIDRSLLASKADFYYLGNGLKGIRRLLEIGARRRDAARRLLAFALAYNAGAIGASLAGAMSPLVAAVIMPASSLLSLAIVARPLARQ